MTRSPQTGFALILAVFLIVILAAMGVYLVTTTTAQVAAASQDEQAARAYQAARTGLEIGAYQLLRGGSANCVATQTIVLSQELSGFRAEVLCAQVNTVGETEGGAAIAVYRVTSKGCNATPCSPASPPATYVERELQITITR